MHNTSFLCMKNALLAISLLLLVTPVLAANGNGSSEPMLISAQTDPARMQVQSQSQLQSEINTAIQTRTQTQLRINQTDVNVNSSCVCVNATQTQVQQKVQLSNQEMVVNGMQVTDETTGVRSEVMAKVSSATGIKSVNMVQEQNKVQIREEGSNVSVSLALNDRVRLENNSLILNQSGFERVLTVLPAQAMNQIGARNQTVRSMELVVEENKAMYKITEQKQARLFGFIPVGMDVISKVSAEDGSFLGKATPWWSFLATEPVD